MRRRMLLAIVCVALSACSHTGKCAPLTNAQLIEIRNAGKTPPSPQPVPASPRVSRATLTQLIEVNAHCEAS